MYTLAEVFHCYLNSLNIVQDPVYAYLSLILGPVGIQGRGVPIGDFWRDREVNLPMGVAHVHQH